MLLWVALLAFGVPLVCLLVNGAKRRGRERKRLERTQAEIARREKSRNTEREKLPPDFRL